ncbi:tetratricopeptide repeat protein [Herbidospora galbida]|uniref:Tetratricopeptide repeat protein n=1 Tax=Herbidospora galbida TaxID=2575442 RepID=A0A4U3LXN8_9ACTN|nr:tetratricopeptide repeat protein [Herbidospora galbida]TKK80710.1 tetratricopeptide repeat protein [Herbidospora galbida]
MTDVHARAQDQAQVHIAARDLYVGRPAAPVRHGLPRDVAAFTGRDDELRRLLTGTAAVRAIDGMPGVGKTALVTHAAHLLSDAFPDGQLFIRLHAHLPGTPPAEPGEILSDLLISAGLAPEEIPAGLDARARAWRDRLAGRRVLLVLDDADGQAQIEPLIPGDGHCLVLITSRRRLLAFDGAEPLTLDPLPPGQAGELFLRLSRRAPGHAEPAAVADLVARCGHLPLAIGLLAGRLAHQPAWSITRYAEHFTAAVDQLDRLAAGDRAVAAAFDLSYRNLPAPRRRLFRLLGLHPGADIDPSAAAALAGITSGQAERELAALYVEHLVEEPVPGRYRLHDLTRAYARSRATTAETGEAIARLLDHYQRGTQAADRHLTVGPGSDPAARAAALAWLRTERGNLLACAEYAIKHSLAERVTALSAALAAFLALDGLWRQAAILHQHAVSAATDDRERANASVDLARMRRRLGDYHPATVLLEEARRLYERHGDRPGMANALTELGLARYFACDYRASAAVHERVAAISRELGDPLREAKALVACCGALQMTGEYRRAGKLLEAALTMLRGSGDHQGMAAAHYQLGNILYLTGRYPAAAQRWEQARNRYADLGERSRAAALSWELARVRYRTGDYHAAEDLLHHALSQAETTGQRLAQANALNVLGRVREATGQAAAHLHERARDLYRSIYDRLGEADCDRDLGRLHRNAGDLDTALRLHERALTAYRSIDHPAGRASALTELGHDRHLLGEHQIAADLLTQALTICRQLPNPVGQAETLRLLGRVRQTTRQPGADAFFEEAQALFQRLGTPREQRILP